MNAFNLRFLLYLIMLGKVMHSFQNVRLGIVWVLVKWSTL